LRITGGSARGRKLAAPKSSQAHIRPTCDRVREALFNILADRIADSNVLDLFAGTGAIGIEALSRGAAFALFVDQSLESGHLIETNLRACFHQPQAAFVQLNLATAAHLQPVQTRMPPATRFDLVFMDPPYQKNLAEQVLAVVQKSDLLASNALVIVEEHRSVILPAEVGILTILDQRRYGETRIWFYGQQPPTS
jgi:16S rRNA (guanine966-N2)-methyltransferase